MATARRIRVVRKIDVTMTAGLVAPSWPADAHPLWWVEDDGKGSRPSIIRFAWRPATGELRVGTQFRHALQVRGRKYPFEAWLRGFSFPRDRAIALRPYHWPIDAYEEFGAAQRRADLRVSRSFLKAIRPLLPDRVLIYLGVDNGFLKDRFGHLSQSW
jgi:hypothetical protein